MSDLPEYRKQIDAAPREEEPVAHEPKPQDVMPILEAGFPVRVAACECCVDVDAVALMWAEQTAKAVEAEMEKRKEARRQAQTAAGANVYLNHGKEQP